MGLAKPDLGHLAIILEQVTGRSMTLDESTSLPHAMNLDSLAVSNFVMELEDAYDVSIPLDRIAEMDTAGDVIRVISAMQEAA